MLQEAFAKHLVSLELQTKLDNQECLSLGALTRLTELVVSIPATPFPDGSHAASSFAALKSLASLELKGTHVDSTVELLDWSALSKLTRLRLENVRGGFAAAGTAWGLQSLHLHHLQGTPSQMALSRMQTNLTCLRFLHLEGTELHGELDMLQHLTSLQSLVIEAMPESTYDRFQAGSDGFCQALGRLSLLTCLYMENSG